MQNEPSLFSGQLDVLLRMVVFEDCANQWSLSRPLLALILTNNAYFARWKTEVLGHQASSKLVLKQQFEARSIVLHRQIRR